jgi:hypothetical protein
VTPTPKSFFDLPRNPLVKPSEAPEERIARAAPAAAPGSKWGLPEPVAVVAMAGGVVPPLGLAALLAPATPTPTPFPSGQAGCHRWKYALHWDRPARLATLKNALGNSVTIYTKYAAPGAGTQDDWPDPIAASVTWTWSVTNPGGQPNAGAWNYAAPPATAGVTATYDHDCDNPAPACKPPSGGDPDGEHPGIYYTIGPADSAGEIRDWSWTLNYGYAKAPLNDVIYGLDPGPPLPVYDLSSDSGGGSIPGTTGTPLAFSTLLTTRGGVPITAPTSPGVGGTGQPTWTTFLPADVVGKTANNVNWGLMTFQDNSTLPLQSQWCTDDAVNYHKLVDIVSDDSGNVSDIEDYMHLKYYTTNGHQGLQAAGGTPTKRAIELAGQNITTWWDSDPKQKCPRPWGVILCTDGLSNTCNTGTTADTEWVAPLNTPCESDINGTDYTNYPPGAAENVYNLKLQAGGGAAVIRPRTYAIGIAPEVGRCELNRIGYRGRSDAVRSDAGFLLFDPTAPLIPGVDPGDKELPWIDAATNDQSGSGSPPNPNHFRQDQSGTYDPSQADYAFFALDTASIVDAFLSIVASTATGDYTASAPTSGGSLGFGNTVLVSSTEYPSWAGRFRALDTSVTPPTVLWDAADVLNSPNASGTAPWQPAPAARALYTWNPSTNVLIPITTAAANVAAMKAISGDPNFNANVVDFMRGFDGTLTNTLRAVQDASGNWKSWLLGPIIDSTPAVIGPPAVYKQAGNVADHTAFEAIYSGRRGLAYVGSDDGFLHAFDFVDGTEIIGLLPPNLLSAQVALYKNYLTGRALLGQVKALDQHIFGVASSLRFVDVYFGTGYKTVAYLTEGPGGDVIAAIDVTHPFPGYPSATPAVASDQNYDPANPVTVLWTKNSSDYTGLYGSWSVPAIAPDSFTTTRMFFGAGINPASLRASSADASLFVVDATDGTLNATQTIPLTNSPSPLVGQQTFAPATFIQTKAPIYLPDNVANLDLQADENGQIWFTYGTFTSSPTTKLGIDLNSASGTTITTLPTGEIASVNPGPATPQPIYYPAAATGQGATGCQIYAMGSGSLYETSPTVSGWNVNRSGPPPSPYTSSLPVFTPYLYVATNPKKITDATFAQDPLGKDPMHTFVVKQRIGGEVPEAIPLPAGDPALSVTQTKLGPRTQVNAPPLMVVDKSGKKVEDALFTLYDPDNGCNGRSYVVQISFQAAADCASPVITAVQTYGAGPGAVSGITVTSGKLFAAKSGIGRGQSAGVTEVPVPVNTILGLPQFVPVWWRDVK